MCSCMTNHENPYYNYIVVLHLQKNPMETFIVNTVDPAIELNGSSWWLSWHFLANENLSLHIHAYTHTILLCIIIHS